MSNHDEFTDKAKEVLAEVNHARSPYQSAWQEQWHPIATALQAQYERGVEDAAKVAEENEYSDDYGDICLAYGQSVVPKIRNLKKTGA